MTGRLKRTGVAAAVALGIAVLAPATFAQTTTPQQDPQQTSQQAPQQTPQQTPQQAPPAQNNAAPPQANAGPPPNDTELKHFADAMMEVQGIRDSLQPKLASAPTDEARNQLKQSAEKQMESAVQSHQLSLQRYVEIANLVQTDSTVRARVQQLLPPQQPSKS